MGIISYKTIVLSVVAAAAVVCCSCVPDNEYYRAPRQEEQGGEDIQSGDSTTPKEYTISSYEYFRTEVKELSSLCFNQTADGLYAVGDEGTVYEIAFDGKTKALLYDKGNHDWEGVECYGSDILLMEETESAIYRLSGGKLSKEADISIPGGGADGKGPEGLTVVRDTAYVGNQAKPTGILKYSLKTGKSCEYFDIKFVSKYVSDLCYDSYDNTLWIIDSKGPAFYHCTLSGKLIATYKIPFVNQAEALAIDHAGGIAWVGCDKTSTLYKIKLEF